MTLIPITHGLILAGILFALGVIGLLARRNLLFILMSLEVMVNSAGLAFVVAGSRWGQADGQVMFIFILSMAAAEVSVGLALLLQIYRRYRTIAIDAISQITGAAAGSALAWAAISLPGLCTRC